MPVEVLRTLFSMTLVSSAAILLVMVLRQPVRVLSGARAAYWLWILVPILTLALLIPVPSPVLQISADSLPAQLRTALVAAQEAALPGGTQSLALPLIWLWLIGAITMFVVMVARQRAFSHSIGTLAADADGLHRSEAVQGPLLLGAWSPRIIVPLDFESRYLPEERELVLAHERAHARRHDVASNLIATTALCVFWFNPLLYRALEWFRADQELACDAHVLMRWPGGARTYANALLKTQLATEAAWRMPFACQWQSTHPLKERIAMLKKPVPEMRRHLAGVVATVVLATGGGYAAWAGQAASDGKGAPILVTIKVTTSDPGTSETHTLATQYVVHSGEIPAGMLDAQPLAFACKPYLPDDPKAANRWKNTSNATNQIFIECELWDGGTKAFTPSMLTQDGRPVIVKHIGRFPGDTESRQYEMEVTATTSKAAIEAAKVSAADR